MDEPISSPAAGGKQDDPNTGADGDGTVSLDRSRCPPEADLRDIWERYRTYDSHTVLGRTSRFTDKADITIEEGADGIILNDHGWTDEDGSLLEKMRNPEYDGLLEEFDVFADQPELAMASFNLVQQFFAIDQFSDMVHIKDTDQLMRDQNDEALLRGFSRVFNSSRELQDDIIAEGEVDTATDADRNSAESFRRRRADVMCFAASLGLELDEAGYARE